jgi:hypothetical protein
MIKKLLHNIPALIVAVLIAWIAFSYIDIVSDNNSVAPVHSNLNAFVLLGGEKN